MISFREALEHEKVRFNPNGTLSYVPRRYPVMTDKLVLDTSLGRGLEDRLVVPNIPLLVSIFSTVTSTCCIFTAFFCRVLRRDWPTSHFLFKSASRPWSTTWTRSLSTTFRSRSTCGATRIPSCALLTSPTRTSSLFTNSDF